MEFMKDYGSAVNIWMLTREYGDLAGAGGVKDVADQLSRALAQGGERKVSVVLPLYGFIDPKARGFSLLHDPHTEESLLEYEVDMNYADEERREKLRVWHATVAEVNIYLLDSNRFREKKDVYTYTAAEEAEDATKSQGEGHIDYFAMNLLLQKGTIQLILLLREFPDVIHCHDGHTAVLPAIIEETLWLKSYFRSTGCLVTMHNAGIGYHQEVFDLPYARAMTGLPGNVIDKSILRGAFDPFVAAGHYAAVNTVSENYARELQDGVEDEQTGMLGHRLLDMGVILEGITNGVDMHSYDPRRGEEIGLAASFDVADDRLIEGKLRCREALVRSLIAEEPVDGIAQYGFLEPEHHGPLFTFIGRLSEQKGVDILHGAVLRMLEMPVDDVDFQIVILGGGTPRLEKEMISLAGAEKSAGRVCFLAGYNPLLANKVYSAGDFFLVPSRYEPCGLTDFIAQLFGNIPIVHYVGGLVKVLDNRTGFTYVKNDPAFLAEAMGRVMQIYENKKLVRSMQKEAVRVIQEKFTWEKVKNHYLQLYKKVITDKITE